MLTISYRTYTDEEKKALLKQFPSALKTAENIVKNTLFSLVVFIIPLLVFDKYRPVSSQTQLYFCIGILFTSIAIAFLVDRKWGTGLNKKEFSKNLKTEVIEVLHVQTLRAIKRADPEDFGIAFYIDILVGQNRKTLYLWGQYLDQLEYEKQFPNSEFEVVRKKNDEEILWFYPIGNHFEPEKILPPFDEHIWKNGTYPVNGQIIDLPIDAII